MARLIMLWTCAAVAASPVAGQGSVLQNNSATLLASTGACGSYPDTGGALPFPLSQMFFISAGDGSAGVTVAQTDAKWGNNPVGIAEELEPSSASGPDTVKGTYKGSCLDSAQRHTMPCDCNFMITDCSDGCDGKFPPPQNLVYLELSCFIEDAQGITSTCFSVYSVKPAQDKQQLEPWWVSAVQASAKNNSSRHL